MSIIQNLESHIAYTSTEDVAAVCRPIFDQFKLNFFKYGKNYYHDGSRVLLCTSKDWVKDYFELEHYNYEYISYGQDYKKTFTVGYNLWSGCNQGHPVCNIWMREKKRNNLDYALAIYRNFDNYTEFFHFGGPGQESHLPTTLLSCIDIFEYFLFYFFEKAKPILDRADKQKFYPDLNQKALDSNRWVLGLEPYEREQIIKNIQPQKFYLSGAYEGKYITRRQLECLIGLLNGKSYREIAQDLHISNRTVDYHINEAKQLFHVKSKRELIQVLQEGDMVHYFKYLKWDPRVHPL